MRLKKSEIELIKETIHKYIQDAVIYIFGSRLDDKKRGGDVDIFIVANRKVDLLSKSKIRFFLEEKLYKPVDLIFHTDYEREIEKEALKGVKIT